jgi:hypothetical protein
VGTKTKLLLQSTHADTALTAHQTHKDALYLHNEVLRPARLLPGHAGVEFRGTHLLRYSIASPEQIKERAPKTTDLAAAIQHCETLLSTELPASLARSCEASDKLLEAMSTEPAAQQDERAFSSSRAELSDLGSLAVEQKRIRAEMDVQHKRLVELRKEQLVPHTWDKERMIQREEQTVLVVPFGVFCLAGVYYHLLNLDPVPLDLADLVRTVETSDEHEVDNNVKQAAKKQQLA